MVTLAARKWLADTGQVRLRVSYRTDLVTVLLAAWVLVGLLLDAWAHNNIAGLESFFTPWHAVLYSGFIAIAVWMCRIVWGNVRAGRRGIAATPVGYGLAVLGLPVFALAGLGDFAWHSIFGIEQDLKILFSPTHLVLAASMTLIATSPLRSQWAEPDPTPAPPVWRLLPAVLAVAFSATGVLVFVQYANALIWSPGRIVASLSDPLTGGTVGHADPVGLVTSIAVTNVVLLAPLLLLARRWPVPPGAATMLYACVAGLCAAITEFAYPAILLAVIVSGLGVDLLLVWLRPGPERRAAVLAFAALAPLLTWSLYLLACYVGRGVPSIVEYWTGVPVVAALHGLLLAVLSGPYRIPAPASPAG
jgi:hypothetical protein